MKYVLILALWLCPVLTATTDQEWDAFAGTWQLVGEFNAAENQIKTAIDQATEKMSFLTRGIARDKLANAIKAQKQIRMQRQNQMFMIHPDTFVALSMPLSGETVKHEERVFRVSLQNEGNCLALHQFADDPRGKRENVYRLQASAKFMELEVTVNSPQIPAPVRYKLRFSRAE